MVLHLDKNGIAVFVSDGVHLVLPAPPGKDTPGLHLVAVLPEEDTHELLKVRLRPEERERSPEVGPVPDGGADGPGPGVDHPEDRGGRDAVRHRLLDLA